MPQRRQPFVQRFVHYMGENRCGQGKTAMHSILINSTSYETPVNVDTHFSVSFTAVTGVRIPLGTPENPEIYEI